MRRISVAILEDEVYLELFTFVSSQHSLLRQGLSQYMTDGNADVMIVRRVPARDADFLGRLMWQQYCGGLGKTD